MIAWVCLGAAYVLGARVAFGYHLRKENEGKNLTLAESFDKWSWDTTLTLEKALAFPILIPLQVFLHLTRFLTASSFRLTDRQERKRLEQVRLRVQLQREVEELERELSEARPINNTAAKGGGAP